MDVELLRVQPGCVMMVAGMLTDARMGADIARGDRCHFRKKLYLVNGAGEQRLPLQVFDVTSPDDFLHSCQA